MWVIEKIKNTLQQYRAFKNRIFTPQRVLFDELIVPELARGKKSVLFVGVGQYNKHLFNGILKNITVTIDPNPLNRKWGAEKHVVGSIPEDVDLIEKFGPYELIFLNGVYGWGLNEKHLLFRALDRLKNVLSNDGLIVFGFNDDKLHNPANILIDDVLSFYEPAHQKFLGNASEIEISSTSYKFWFLRKS